ncbi:MULTISPECIES: capsular biosynthesis protein [unclassified Pseudoalteromonas]|uniref:capsular polysaccharide export protein, LipB/KpsS family n=1 Tax=unclassified Pseudoalteromonas TaxID=194690 RepID=UPI0016019C46|nr:capsular biosynthesis protein [Pseudoalteromonas sp. SG45-3]MBB1358581.1 capsular biosynthesis protein [Pseudoalteromonas sp. SG45-6]
MAYLFISRKNVHAKYYKKIIKKLSMNCQLHIMGAPKLSAVKYLKDAFQVNFTGVVNSQLKRKRARNTTWNNSIVTAVYSAGLVLFERLRYAKYLALLTETNPEYIVIWNGNKLPNTTVAMAAKALGVKQFYYENGLLPGTSSLDPNGINYNASLSRDPSFYLNFDPQNKLNFSAPDLIPRADHKKRCEFECADVPERYIFAPFQVPHDTQLASFSPWINSMDMFYDEVIKAVKSLNDPSLKVVFKEHPSWHKHYSHLYEKDPIAIFANGNQTSDLIKCAEAVLTINSTVGLEALLLNKRVLTLGQACYNIEGLVKHASTAEQLAANLNEVMQGWQPNTLLKDKFFSFIEHVYCIPGVWKHTEDKHIKAIEARFTGNDEFAKYHGDKES